MTSLFASLMGLPEYTPTFDVIPQDRPSRERARDYRAKAKARDIERRSARLAKIIASRHGEVL